MYTTCSYSFTASSSETHYANAYSVGGTFDASLGYTTTRITVYENGNLIGGTSASYTFPATAGASYTIVADVEYCSCSTTIKVYAMEHYTIEETRTDSGVSVNNQ
jgi:hypothetical protein